MKVLTLIESPWRGETKRNRAYALDCLRDSLKRGEVAFASHLLYTQVLDDTDDGERELGLTRGLKAYCCAIMCAVYIDLGISDGMRRGIAHAHQCGVTVDVRSLDGWRTK